MDEQILATARAALKSRNLSGALLASPFSITWLTGYAAPIMTGPSPFEGSPALAWLDFERVVLIVSDAEQGAAAATGAETVTYLSYQIEKPLEPARLQAESLLSFLKGLDRPARLGVESMPSHLWRQVIITWPDQPLIEIDGWTAPLRAVKTPAEIAKIQASCDLCSAAQATLATSRLDGKSELALFGEILTAIEQKAGQRLPVLADFVAGVQTAQIGGPPRPYIVQPGDPVLADIVPRLNGYWGDICNVRFAGEPSPELKKFYLVAREALYTAMDTVKPGIPANEIDRVVRAVIEKHGYPAYPHHTGHGVGVAYHEEPRLCAYDRTPLQPGMIIAVEPGVYVPNVGGVRLENVLLVTQNGCESLTHHSFDL